MIYGGDCLEILKTLDDNSVDSLVTDPPAGISFMGKEWDDDKGGRDAWIKWMSEVMRECLRVLKPGAHGFVWALPRTSHWTATALEDAGFEVRDVVTHLFGSGFPKSLNISIAIDKQAGVLKARGKAFCTAGRGNRADIQDQNGKSMPSHEPITNAAKQWVGWGTALKPSCERWLLIRKPDNYDVLLDELWYAGDEIGELLCRLSSVKFAERLSTLNLNASEMGGLPDSVRWLAAALNTLKSLTQSEMMGMFKSPEAASTFSSIALSWSAISGAVLKRQRTFTIETRTRLTTELRILRSLVSRIMQEDIILEEMKKHGWWSSAGTASAVLSASAASLEIILTLSVPETAGDSAASNHALDAVSRRLANVTTTAPFSEDFILVRKPLGEKTVASNVLKYGTGGINIDASRIEGVPRDPGYAAHPETLANKGNGKTMGLMKPIVHVQPTGRFPANLVLDEEAAALLDEQSMAGGMHSAGKARPNQRDTSGDGKGLFQMHGAGGHRVGDSGGASRFFYCAKASSAEKNAGLEGMPLQPPHPHRTQKTEQDRNGGPRQNSHPTVKALKLMQYLIRMITPPGGTVLDPFMGSGSTGVAAKSLGFSFTGIEREPEYLKIAERRLAGLK